MQAGRVVMAAPPTPVFLNVLGQKVGQRKWATRVFKHSCPSPGWELGTWHPKRPTLLSFPPKTLLYLMKAEYIKP